MDARRKEIEHLETEVRRLEQQITLECVEIGRRVAALDSQSLHHQELLNYLISVDTLRRSAESFRADIDRIRALTRQIEVRSQEIDENARRRDALLRERHSRYVELGAGAFALYKSIPE